MRQPNNSEIVKTVLDLLAAGDLGAATAYISDDFICREAASLPYAGEYRGKQGFRDLGADLATTWNDFGFKIHMIFGDGEHVSVIETIWGKVAGKPWQMPVIEVWKLRDGKVLEVTPYYHDAGPLGRFYEAQKKQ